MPLRLSDSGSERFTFHVHCSTQAMADAVSRDLIAALGGAAASHDTRNPDEPTKRWIVKFDLPNDSDEEARDLLGQLEVKVQAISAAHGAIVGLTGFSTLG